MRALFGRSTLIYLNSRQNQNHMLAPFGRSTLTYLIQGRSRITRFTIQYDNPLGGKQIRQNKYEIYGSSRGGIQNINTMRLHISKGIFSRGGGLSSQKHSSANNLFVLPPSENKTKGWSRSPTGLVRNKMFRKKLFRIFHHQTKVHIKESTLECNNTIGIPWRCDSENERGQQYSMVWYGPLFENTKRGVLGYFRGNCKLFRKQVRVLPVNIFNRFWTVRHTLAE